MNTSENRPNAYRNLALIRVPLWIIDVRGVAFRLGQRAGVGIMELAEHRRVQYVGIWRRTSHPRCVSAFCSTATIWPAPTTRWPSTGRCTPQGSPQSYECVITDLDTYGDDGCLLVQAVKKDEVSSPDTLYRANALLHTSVYVSVYDQGGEMVYANPAARRRLGSSRRCLAERFCNQVDWLSMQGDLALNGRVTAEALVHTLDGDAWHSLTLESCPDPVSGSDTVFGQRAGRERAARGAATGTRAGLC